VDRCSFDPTIKQHLAAIMMLFDWLVTGQVVEANSGRPSGHRSTSSRRAKRRCSRPRKPPRCWTASRSRFGPQPKEGEPDTRPHSLIGLRDRALIGVMVYSFARVGAVTGMEVRDYYQKGKRWWLRLHEKGGKFHEVPAHHNTEAYLDAYLEASGIAADPKSPPLPLRRRQDRPAHRPAAWPQERPRHGETPG
jgi:integrase/recombinase XerD